jgi:hypothetical protein
MVSPPLQRLLVNLSHKIKWVKQHGRNYLVAPMTLINPGVLNGSKGPLLYPPEEVASRPQKWNGVPIVVYHPHRLGQPVSAAEPGILDSQGVGEVRNATSNGKLQAEGWFDVQKMQKINPVLLQRLLKNEAIELSTGLYTDNEDRSGTFNGRPYTAIARNYKPDHLAILPDQTGACSIKDGCGVLVNSSSLNKKLRSLSTNNQEFNMDLQNKLSLLVNADPDCIDKENCDSKEDNSCSSTKEENCDNVNNQDSSSSVTLKTDSPTKLMEPDTLKAAIELHGLIAGAAESPLKQECLKASEKFLKKFQAHLDDAEEENKDTEVQIDNAWSDEARQAALEARRAKMKGKQQKESVDTSNDWTDEDRAAALESRKSSLSGDKHIQAVRSYLITHPELLEQSNKKILDHLKSKGIVVAPPAVVKQGIQEVKEAIQGRQAYWKAFNKTNNTEGETKPVTDNQHIQKEGGQYMAQKVVLTKNERKAVVDGLITNEACCWEESDREVLNELNDTTLAKLHRQIELVGNAEMSDILGEDDEEDVAVEEEKTKEGDSQADGKVAPTGDLDPGKKGEPATNALSEQDRRDLAFARHYRMAQRKQHIGVITANANNKFTAKQLDSMDDRVLANMALLAKTQEENDEMLSMDAMSRPNFFGAQGAAVINTKTGIDDEPLMLGKIDYKELAANNGRK